MDNNNKIERQKMQERCEIFGVKIEDVEARLAAIGRNGLLVSRFDDDEAGYKFREVKYFDVPGLHLNRFYFAMASLILKNVKNVLEIGTGDALSTATLASLFPNAQKMTIDLPFHDNMYKRWHNKGGPGTRRGQQRQKRLSRHNITSFRLNTFFISTLPLPRRFDFILVDGDHVYPQVAGDIMFAYSRIAKGGFIFFHDYYEISSPNCQVKEAVDWMAKRIPEKLFVFPMGTPPKRQHQKMAFIVKGLMKNEAT